MKIAIHQPEHLPWLGFFHKIAQVDTFVILDNVQFRKNYFQNRNKIRSFDNWLWITVPVRYRGDTLIKDVRISPDNRWKRKWLDSIRFYYRKSTYFDIYYDKIASLLDGNTDNLAELNISLLRCICGLLGIEVDFILASQLSVDGKGCQLILNICKNLNATVYLSGISGKEYLTLDDFSKENIRVEFQEFHHPIYKQLQGTFIPRMSVIDLLFNYGKKSMDIIDGIGVPVMNELFL